LPQEAYVPKFILAYTENLSIISHLQAADILGDKKRDTKLTKLSATSAFFTSRSLGRILFRIAGVPRPIAILFATLAGSVISEMAKYIGRVDRSHFGNLELADEVISWSEISG
jgi:hypothetical protein